MTVTIDANTKLVLKQSKGPANLFAEVYCGWETGVILEAPIAASAVEVAELYQA